MIACSPKYYSPNTQNVPLITEKERPIHPFGNGNQIEIQGAYGISQSIALKANGGLFIPKDLENGMEDPENISKLVVGIIKLWATT